MKSRLPSLLPGIAIVIAVILFIPRYAYNDPDTFWHIELGRYMIDHTTVLHHAIHTFYGDKLPYVPHEFGFQIVIAALYRLFGWPGCYLLAAVSLFLLILGLYRLTRVSRKEMGQEERRPVLLLLVMTVAGWIYYGYFAIRPQMVSAWMIVWFFVSLREFQMRPRMRYAASMIALSLAVANFHAGVWLVVAAFTAMAAIESWIGKSLDRRRLWVFGAVWAAGIVNPGGLRSILFILTVTKGNFNLLIEEWQPIRFTSLEGLPILLLLLLFACSLPFFLGRKPFRYLFMAGILVLGVSSYKQNLFMWLFIPYIAAGLPEEIPKLSDIRIPFGEKALGICLAVGLAVNVASIFVYPPSVDAKQYPVEEMNAILARTPEGVRPKVMAPYGVSGYVMFRGGDVLCDGRQDPFVTDASKGALGWNAFQRSMYGYGEYLPEIVRADKPDYVIARSSVSAKLLREWAKEFGEPVYKGKFGSVFAIRNGADG